MPTGFPLILTTPLPIRLLEHSWSKKTNNPVSGRVVLDAGINFDNRTLREINNPQKFTSPNAFFSYLQLGIPVKPNWGISFGLRPVSKISYRVFRNERLFDPVTQLPIDSARTEFTGEGGAFLASTGTGVGFGKFSAGINFGYLFGKKDYSSRRTLLNDTVQYLRGHYQSRTSLGDIFWSGGIQFRDTIVSKKSDSKERKYVLSIGAYGNLEQKINARQDIVRETFVRSPDNGDTKLDSVFEQRNIKGTMIYPSGIGAGIIFEKVQPDQGDEGGWLIGMDFISNNWDNYRFYGATDAVQNNWELRLGDRLNQAFHPGITGAMYPTVAEHLSGRIILM
ncbi:MAG: hypothetical protein HC867_06585 [Bacteroidia bacterium]|nr:hypothetical protein [Bacteroidia bacterium]